MDYTMARDRTIARSEPIGLIPNRAFAMDYEWPFADVWAAISPALARSLS